MSTRPADPAARADSASLDRLLRSCVECGLCLPHCATYLATGNEVQSPRGRIMLLGGVVRGELAASDPAVREACDQCLGCLACTTVCPSGISATLIEEVQAFGRAGGERAGLLRLLDRRGLLAALRRLGGAARSLLAVALGPRWRWRLAAAPWPLPRLARRLASLPADPGPDHALAAALDALVAARGGRAAAAARVPGPAAAAAAGPTARRPAAGAAPRVAWFEGCADAALLPHSSRRLRALLTGLGCEVVVPDGQDCCGALAAHRGAAARAAGLQARNLAAFASHLPRADHVVVASSGCNHHLRGYPADLADRTCDATVLLAELLSRSQAFGLAAVPLRVAVHDPCHGRHGQGVTDAPRDLLRRIPDLEIVEPAETDVCCGAAGTYTLRHSRLATAMGARKAAALAATGCDLVVTTNAGCLGQLADGLGALAAPIAAVPLTDLVWYAWRRAGAERTMP